MNKTLKKMLATVSAVAMCALTTVNVNVFAVEDDSPIDRIIKSYGESYLTYENDINTFKKGLDIFAINKDNIRLLTQCVDVYINMKDGKTLPIIPLENAKIRIAEVGYQFTKYRLIAEDDEAQMKAIEAISKCDEVLSVDKVYTVYGEPAYSWADGAWVKTNDETKDILSEYKFSDDKYVLGHWNDGTPITSDEHKYIPFNSTAECYAFMEKMQDTNIEYMLNIYSAANLRHIIEEETIHLYTSDDYDLYFNDNIDVNSPEPTLMGDATEDGEVNIADAVLIMQALSNPNEYKLTPQGMANADMDGDGVTAMDALKIQEMILNW